MAATKPVSILRPVGDRAVLVELGTLAEVLSLQAHLEQHPLAGQVDVVAAATTVLVTADSARAARGYAEALRHLDLTEAVVADDTLVTIDTIYDGLDLDDVAGLTGLSREAVIAAHGDQTWTAAFGGFAPGFAYLVGENSALAVPRRSTPRPSVPAGSVALADTYSAVYPRVSPGGWQLIGHTTATMWDLDRPQPALVRPGNRVQFRAVRASLLTAAAPAAPATPLSLDPAEKRDVRPSAGLIVRNPGLQTTVQDLGRPGYASLGVAGSGALDRGAVRQANRLAGNAATAAVLENALGGLVLHAVSDEVLAVTGATVSLEVTDGDGCVRSVSGFAPFALLAGETLTIGTPTSGVRSYVAVRGGFDTPVLLGSRATDTMSGIGPAVLVAGSALAVLPAPPTSVVGSPETGSASLPGTGSACAPDPASAETVTELRYVPGPRADWFSAETLAEFSRQSWTVTAQSNRIGLRLAGEALRREKTGELASEGTVSGAIQLPASGLPVLFLADHPVTGGYPVLGVVLECDLDRAAQLPTGAHIRFLAVPRAASVLSPQ